VVCAVCGAALDRFMCIRGEDENVHENVSRQQRPQEVSVFGDGKVTAFRLSKRSPMLHTDIHVVKEEQERGKRFFPAEV
jgi:hypothetical protein